MKKMLLISVLIFIFLNELGLRALFTLPTTSFLRFDKETSTLVNRENTHDYIPTRRKFELGKYTQFNTEKLHPPLSLLNFDRNGYTAYPENAQNLLLGDSVSLRWPYSYADGSLAQSQNPPAVCAMIGASPRQLQKLLHVQCNSNKAFKTVVVQITLSDSLAFPDAIYQDLLGADFQLKMGYLFYQKGEQVFNVESWMSPTPEQQQAIYDFADSFFNSAKIYDWSYLSRLYFYLNNPMPRPDALASAKKLETLLKEDLNITKNVQPTVDALKALRNHFAAERFVVYFHPTKERALKGNMPERPEVEILKEALRAEDMAFMDPLDDKNYQEQVLQLYLDSDFHPNQKGYLEFSKKIESFF